MRWFLGRLLTSLALLSVLAMGGAVATSTGRGLSPMLGALRGSDSAPPVSRGTFIVADVSGHVMVLDARGRVVRRIPGSFGTTNVVQALDLAPDRRHAYVAVYAGSGSITLYALDLGTGHRHKLAAGFSPALDPARTRLAYVSLRRSDYEKALVIRDLRDGRDRVVPFPKGDVAGTPPELVLNWSPDGRRIAVLDGRVIRLVDVARAPSIDWRVRSGTLLVQDALAELVLVTRGHVHLVATKIAAAAPA